MVQVGVFLLSTHKGSTSKPTGYKHPTLHYVMQREALQTTVVSLHLPQQQTGLVEENNTVKELGRD